MNNVRKTMLLTARIILSLSITAVATSNAYAGTIEGKASPGAVVYVDTIQGKTFPAPDKEVTIGQKSLTFTPHVTVVQKGTTVEFQNDDSVQHNVFWPSISGNKKDGHNLGTWPKGDKRAFKFDQPGVVPLLCNVHPEMSGYLVVSPTPYFAQADSAGNYKIDGLPDGKYNVVAWHEGSKPVTKSVDVAGTGKAEFTMGK